MDCIFCAIAAGEVPAQIVHQDDEVVVFRDLHPVAPTHLLIIPRRHIATVNDLTPQEAPLVGRLLTTASALAKAQGFAADGYRLVMNCNGDGGQTVFHLHLHLLAGRRCTWPPG